MLRGLIMFAVTIAAGQCMAFPDVCQTPAPPSPSPVPIPYPNIAMPMMGAPPAATVLVVGAPALNVSSKIPLSQGDEAGVAMGVASGQIMGQAAFVTSSMKVSFCGSPAVRLGDSTTQNNNNTVGTVAVPSQSVVMIMS